MKTWQIVTVMVIALIVIVGGIVFLPNLLGNEESQEDGSTETAGTGEGTAATQLGA